MRLFDSNILIDHLKSIPAATAELERDRDVYISIVTWIEVMAGASPQNPEPVLFVLSHCIVLPLTHAIAERAAAFRRSTKLKLPDAIILATAQLHSLPLVTRNTRDFAARPDIHIPYSV